MNGNRSIERRRDPADDLAYRDWRALGWIVMAAMVAVTAFLIAPFPE